MSTAEQLRTDIGKTRHELALAIAGGVAAGLLVVG